MFQADGNILHVYHKTGSIASSHTVSAPRAPTVPSVTPLGPRADRSEDYYSDHRNSERHAPRERSRERGRRDYDRDDVMDGSYGFEDRMETDDNSQLNGGKGLYSDTLINSNRGRGRGNSRDRGRGTGNGYDRGRGYR